MGNVEQALGNNAEDCGGDGVVSRAIADCLSS